MSTLRDKILVYCSRLPEGRLLSAAELLRLGNRKAVSRVLLQLVRSGALIRIGRGLYVRAVESRFGVRAPASEKVIAQIALTSGEVIAPHGAMAANALRLTTQVPMRLIYLTSGRNRCLRLGTQMIELRHAPPWMLTHAGKHSSVVIRALAWVGPEGVRAALMKIRPNLSEETRRELVSSCMSLPRWLGEAIKSLLAPTSSARVANVD